MSLFANSTANLLTHNNTQWSAFGSLIVNSCFFFSKGWKQVCECLRNEFVLEKWCVLFLSAGKEKNCDCFGEQLRSSLREKFRTDKRCEESSCRDRREKRCGKQKDSFCGHDKKDFIGGFP